MFRGQVLLDYLVTGEEEPAQLFEEKIEEEQIARWMDLLGGLQQRDVGRVIDVFFLEVGWKVPFRSPEEGRRITLSSEQVPLLREKDSEIRLLYGGYGEKMGEPNSLSLWDVTLLPGGIFEEKFPIQHTTFVYVFGGEARFGQKGHKLFSKGSFLRTAGPVIRVETGCSGVRFLLFSGNPLEREREKCLRKAPKKTCKIPKIEQNLKKKGGV